MSRERIAIVGGGMSGLTAAFELTRTPELRDRYDVTVYQIGWRLGGKLASGREAGSLRNVEHGLHVWFGFYENAFRLLKDVLAEWRPDPRAKLTTWEQVMVPRRYTPVGENLAGEETYFPLLWPDVPAEPGALDPRIGLWARISQLIETALGSLRTPPIGLDAELPPRMPLMERVVAEIFRLWRDERVSRLISGLDPLLLADDRPFSAPIDRLLRSLVDDRGRPRVQHRLFVRALDAIAAAARRLRGSRYDRFRGLFVEYLVVLLKALVDERWKILLDWDLNRIDHLEFTELMAESGASRELLDSWFIRVLYESIFQYEDGDRSRPNMEAGTAVRMIMRLLNTYRRAPIFEVEGGMGDLVIAPLYEVLAARGVRFQFFHRLEKIELSACKKRVARLLFEVQAKTRTGAPYQPLIEVDHAPAWPAAPLLDQLEDGCADASFESCWDPHRGSHTAASEGRDFDRVVLALAMGAFKDPRGICEELIEHSPPFRSAVRHLGLVPSLSVQVWTDDDLAGLGFEHRRRGVSERPAMTTGPPPLSIWADMSQVLDVEKWPAESTPRGVHYFCGVWPSRAYLEPRSAVGVQQREDRAAMAETVRWFERHSTVIWPKMQWASLHDPIGREGSARLEAQHVRANVDPNDCCVASHRDTSRYRLRAEESGFDNLVLAGTWIRTGMNACCVEGAVMAGMAAARALSGSPSHIVGWSFMQRW